MIDITIPGTKEKKWKQYGNSQVYTYSNTGPKDSIQSEALRRNACIKKLVAECPYKVGDTVFIKDSKGRQMYGDKIIVLAIVDNYALLGKEEVWPTNDNPMIVYAKSYEKDVPFYCTVGYLTKDKPN